MNTVPVITIYVRHQKTCKYKDEEFTRKCKCRKWLRWSKNGRYTRISAETRSWDEAEQVKRDKEKELSGVTPESENTAKGIEEAIEVFLADKKVGDISEDVQAKYVRELKRLRLFCEGRGVYFVTGINRELLTRYAATWAATYPSSQTRSVVRTRCRGFLRYCFEAQWIPRIPPLPKIVVDEVPTMPLTDEEYERLLDAAGKFKAPPPPAQVRALVQLMRWTGLSITDALTLPRREFLHYGKVYRVVTAREKTGTDVSVVLPPGVGAEIEAVAGETYLFWDGESDIAKKWSKYVMLPLFKEAKIPQGGSMKSHRLRDTFAVYLLMHGVGIEDVSKLLGHKSIKTTERSYAKWVKGRQDRLDDIVTGTWDQEKEKS